MLSALLDECTERANQEKTKNIVVRCQVWTLLN
jgi:hypothetical protein